MRQYADRQHDFIARQRVSDYRFGLPFAIRRAGLHTKAADPRQHHVIASSAASNANRATFPLP